MIRFFIIPQSFKPDDVDSGIGKSDDNATAAANAGFPHEKEVEMVKGAGDTKYKIRNIVVVVCEGITKLLINNIGAKGDNLRHEEDEERSKLLSPELVMNQKMMLDSESPGLARAATGNPKM